MNESDKRILGFKRRMKEQYEVDFEDGRRRLRKKQPSHRRRTLIEKLFWVAAWLVLLWYGWIVTGEQLTHYWSQLMRNVPPSWLN